LPTFEKYTLAATGTTGNNTHDAVHVGGGYETAIVQFVVEAAGAGPTVTWKVQGRIDDGSDWFDLGYVTDSNDTFATTTRTATATGKQLNFSKRKYKYLRLVTTLNTNITYRCEVYLT